MPRFSRLVPGVTSFLFTAALAAAATLPSGFQEQTFSGITNPVALSHAPDGRVFVSQQCGHLRVIKNGAVLSTPFATLPVSCTDERGLHSIAFDPDFAANGYVYVRFTRASPVNNVIGRLRASAPGSDVSDGTVTVIWSVPFNNNRYHHGGALIMGHDGKLYSGYGDHQTGTGQNLNNLYGKVIRINTDGSIPADNPFFNTTSGDNRATWAYGFRNPFMMAIQRTTGRIMVNDAGDSATGGREEINLLTRGGNYNWPSSQGPGSYFSYAAAAQGGNVITGGSFYNPVNEMFPSSYVGRYFFADYGGGWIRSINSSGSPGTLQAFASGISGPTDLEAADDGSLWYTARNSNHVRRITYPTPFPGTPTPTVTPMFTPTPTPTPGPTPHNDPPICDIVRLPGTYTGGDQLCFEAYCSDPEEGPLPASQHSWDVVFHHNTHTHPGAQFVGVKFACFEVPRDGEWDPDQWWRVNLTARDSTGLTATFFRDTRPRTQALTVGSDPIHLVVSADGDSGLGPMTVQAVVGMKRILDTVSPQTWGEAPYYFQSWSDGGAKRHDIYMADAPTTYTANFSADYVEITPPCGSWISASTSDSNGPCNAFDNNLATRWSGNGDGAWLKVDLGAVRSLGHVTVAAYQGNLRRNRFDLQVSNDNVNWTNVYSGETSGTTTQEEPHDFADVDARWFRYVGHGNIGSTNPTMNSVTEISLFGSGGCSTCPVPTVTPTPTPIADDCVLFPPPNVIATASTHDGNVPANALDGDLATRWSGNGDGAWLQVDLQSVRTVCYVQLAFFNGTTRRHRFDLQLANAPGIWSNALVGAMSSGTTTGLETFDFADADARYVRYLGHGNTDPLKSTWNSVSEFKVFVKPIVPVPTATPTETPTPVATPTPTPTTDVPPPDQLLTPPASGVTASTHDGNVPANTVDDNLATRWSANGDGQWIQYDLGAVRTVTYMMIAAYNGNTRQNRFDIAVSDSPAGPWTNVLTNAATSGTTTAQERIDFADVNARYVRYVGHMSNVGTFNSVTEVDIWGRPCTTCPTPPPPTPTPTPGSGGPTAEELLAKMAACTQDSNGTFKTDTELARTIPVCRATGGYWWKADMDIDCDGVRTSQCNENTDPWYQPDTALHTSTGQPFNSATTPYVVIPQSSSTWSFSSKGIALGAVFAVIYDGKVEYGVFADTGPADIIGEASYAMATRLGINPDPHNGGSDGPVWYLVFPGSKVQPVESHSDAVTKGQALARQFVNSN